MIKGTLFNLLNRNPKINKYRMNICLDCEHCIKIKKIGYVCEKCGCILESKTRVINEKCKLKKW